MRNQLNTLAIMALSMLIGSAYFGPVVVAQDAPTPAEKAKQAAEAAPAPTPAAADELALSQSQLADKYARLEELMLKMASLESASNPRRAALLTRAVLQSKERLTKTQLETIVTLLNQQQLKRAVDGQTTVQTDLKALLELLMSEDRSDRLKNEQARIKEYIKEVERLIRLQKGLEGQNQSGGDADRLAKDQEQLAGRTGDLAKKIKENEEGGEPSPEGSDEQSSDEQKAPMNGEKKPGEQGDQKPGDEKSGDPSKSGDSEQKPGDMNKSGESSQKGSDEQKPGEKPGDEKPGDEKSADEKSGDEKPGDKKPGDMNKSGEESKPTETKPGETKPGEQKPSEAGDSESKPMEGSPSEQGSQKSKPSKSQSGKPMDGLQGQPSDSDSQEQQQQSEEQQAQDNPARQRIEQAQQKMRDAQKKLEEAKRKESVEDQRAAREELEKAKAELEEILRQMREEEVKRTLAALEQRFKKMLEMQLKVYESTRRLDQLPEENRGDVFVVESGKLAFDERKIATEAFKALTLLQEEGSSVAFPASVEAMHDDMQQAAERLGDTKIDDITIGIEEDIIAALEEMIEALQKAQQDMEKKQQQQQQQQQQGEQEQPLVDQIAELKMIKALQLRVNKRTTRYARLLENEEDAVGQASSNDLVEALQKLSSRQQEIFQITRDIVIGKNK